MTNCLFCKIVERTVPANIVYENAYVLAFLDIGPVTKGHTLVVPKIHSTDLNSGSKESAAQLMEAVYTLAPRLMKALGATGYNLGINHGVDAGQEVFHTHLHVMPRFAGKERTFVKKNVSQEELERIAEQINH